MDFVPEDAGGNESAASELSLASQQALIRDADTMPGIPKFGDALVRGQLSKFIPLHLDDADKYAVSTYDRQKGSPGRTSFGGVDELHYNLTAPESSSGSRRVSIGVKTTDTEKPLRIQGHRTPSLPSTDTTGNKGLSVDLRYKLTGGDAQFDQGIVYVQTSKDKMAYDAVVVIGSEGQVTDILPPGDFHAEKNYGDTMRDGEARSDLGNLSTGATHALDQFKAAVAEGDTKLAHERSPIEYPELQTDVASVLGMTVSELFTAKVDPVATFDKVMNEPFNVKPALHGEGEVSVPPIVFKAS